MASEAVRVIVRCRPENSREKALKCKTAVDVDEERNQVFLKKAGAGTKQDKPFTFDGSYGSDSKTSTIYAESAASLIESVIEGFNATVFAYGQTGCGKSFTMEGPKSDLPIDQNEFAGIIPRACADLFDSVALEDTGKKFLVHASYLELYNENVRDLLSDKEKGAQLKHLDLKEHPDRGVYGLTMHRITSAKQAQKLMTKGWTQRSTGETLMNQESSRSHAIFTIYVETELEDNIRAGKLHLVDLAGSERQAKTKATGQRLKEAAKINLSLSALGNVISSLVDGKSKHIPYRDSKLTRILQDSLGGNTKTLMIACISPADNNYEETLSTLRYADRAKQIKNAPRINEDPKDALLRQYADEIQQLKELLNNQLGVDGLRKLVAAQKSGQKIDLPSIDKLKIQEIPDDDKNLSSSEGVSRENSTVGNEESEKLKYELAKAIERLNMESEKRAELERELTMIRSGSTLGQESSVGGPKSESFRELAKIDENNSVPGGSSSSSGHSLNIVDQDGNEADSEEFENDPEIKSEMSESQIKFPKVSKSKVPKSQTRRVSNSSEIKLPQQIEKSSEFSTSQVKSTPSQSKITTRSVQPDTLSNSTIQEIQAASPSHEKQLARLMQLQRGFVRSTHIDNQSLELIKKKKKVIKTKQAAAEKRRELAKKAVEAQNDEEMFQALFENVHEDVRFQKGQVDRAKDIIGKLRTELKEANEGFKIEKLKLEDQIFQKEKESKLLEGIIDKIQPTVKRDCNYYNVDRIKKQAVWNDEENEWELPGLRLERDGVGSGGPGGARDVSGRSQLVGRQSALLNRGSSVLTNTGVGPGMGGMKPRRLQPLSRMDDDF
jgi:kinesin family protein 3/17